MRRSAKPAGVDLTEPQRALVDELRAFAKAGPIPPGGWLRAARRAKGVSQRELAVKLGFRRQAWAQLEASEARGAISLYSLRRAAAALGFDLVYALVPQAAESAASGGSDSGDTGAQERGSGEAGGAERRQATGYPGRREAEAISPSEEAHDLEGTDSQDWGAEDLPTELR